MMMMMVMMVMMMSHAEPVIGLVFHPRYLEIPESQLILLTVRPETVRFGSYFYFFILLNFVRSAHTVFQYTAISHIKFSITYNALAIHKSEPSLISKFLLNLGII